MPPQLVPIISALAGLVGVIVSIVAIILSRQAVSTARMVAEIDRKIEYALSLFRNDLARDDLFAKEDIVDLRLKGVDNSLKNLDHRCGRNTEHISMIFNALLKAGLMNHLRGEEPRA